MLLAEIRGHGAPQVEGSEDYLTSAVFGHLRYLTPSVFWTALFSRAKALPRNGSEETLLEAVTGLGIEVSKYTSLRIHFWPKHPLLGEPDMVLHFEGARCPPLVVVTEVKLWAEKSGVREFDQLVRYLRILDDLSGLRITAEDALKFLLYLTPRESLPEIKDSLTTSGAQESDEQKIYRIQWQDVLVAIRESTASTSGFNETILRDVGHLLERRGLEYFNGFKKSGDLDRLKSSDGSFYLANSDFNGFTHLRDLGAFEPKRGSWAR